MLGSIISVLAERIQIKPLKSLGASQGDKQYLYGDNQLNYLYTIEVAVGTPGQKSQFLIDSESTNSYVFAENMIV